MEFVRKENINTYALDKRYVLQGPVDLEAFASTVQSATAATPAKSNAVTALTERVSALEADVAELKKQLLT